MSKLQEIAKQKGKQLLIESISLNIPKENIQIISNTVLTEAIGDKNYQCKAILKNVPISKYTENANSRIYSRVLWEIVERKKLAERTVSLMGHPEDDGNPKDICGVWHNFKVGETCPTADLYLVGQNGELILEAIQAGARVGVSSVGYGTFREEDGKTVDPETFELERAGDMVLQPSQGVYATNENLEKQPEPPSKDRFTDQIEKSTIISENRSTNNKAILSSKDKEDTKNILKEQINNRGIKMENLEKLYEANHKNQINALIEEAKEMSDVKKAIQKLSTLEVVDVKLKEDVNVAVKELQFKLAEQAKNAEASLKDKEVEVKKLNEDKEKVEKDLKELTEKYNKASEVVSKMSESDKELKTAKVNLKKMYEDIKAVKKIIESKNAKKSGVKTLKDIEIMIESYPKVISDVKYLYNALRESEKRIKIQEKTLKEYGYAFEDEIKDEKPVDEEIDKNTDVVPDAGEEIVMPEPGDQVVEEEGEETDEFGNYPEVEEEIEVGTSNAPLGQTVNTITPTNEPDTTAKLPKKYNEIGEEIEVDTDEVPEDGEMVNMDEVEGDAEPEDKDDVEFPVEEAEGEEEFDKLPWEEDEADPNINRQDDAYMGEEGPEGEEEKMPWDEEEAIDEPKDDEEVVEEVEEPKEDEEKVKQESIAKRREINLFVTREVKRNSALRDIEVQLRKSANLTEAIQKIDKFLTTKKDKAVKVTSKVPVKESVQKKVEPKKGQVYKYVFRRN